MNIRILAIASVAVATLAFCQLAGASSPYYSNPDPEREERDRAASSLFRNEPQRMKGVYPELTARQHPGVGQMVATLTREALRDNPRLLFSSRIYAGLGWCDQEAADVKALTRDIEAWLDLGLHKATWDAQERYDLPNMDKVFSRETFAFYGYANEAIFPTLMLVAEHFWAGFVNKSKADICRAARVSAEDWMKEHGTAPPLPIEPR